MSEIASLVLSELGRALNSSLIFELNGIVADDWQREALESICSPLSQDKWQLWNLGRRCGKSTTAAAAAVTLASRNPGSLVVFVGPSERISKENIRRCLSLIDGAGYAGEILKRTMLEIEFRSKARILALPGKADTIRGLGDGIIALISDETAYTDEVVFPAVLPYLATNDQAAFVCLSTPRGMNNFFAREWHEGSRWKRFKIPSSSCPRISAAYLEEMKEKLGPLYAQEFENSFLDEDSELFTRDMIFRAVDPELQAICL
ncbi:hypothetical protein ACFOOP_14195 [Marinicaulis aureus]|uniref:Terminase n=1 Tax=Hyphococcus aureus TaxID=2666033 RepID=A0ABW1KY08_9PROT